MGISKSILMFSLNLSNFLALLASVIYPGGSNDARNNKEDFDTNVLSSAHLVSAAECIFHVSCLQPRQLEGVTHLLFDEECRVQRVPHPC